ncbi:MAG: hypothetical protein ACFFCQ_14040 [Promethearchaeota archaeon]
MTPIDNSSLSLSFLTQEDIENLKENIEDTLTTIMKLIQENDWSVKTANQATVSQIESFFPIPDREKIRSLLSKFGRRTVLLKGELWDIYLERTIDQELDIHVRVFPLSSWNALINQTLDTDVIAREIVKDITFIQELDALFQTINIHFPSLSCFRTEDNGQFDYLFPVLPPEDEVTILYEIVCIMSYLEVAYLKGTSQSFKIN